MEVETVVTIAEGCFKTRMHWCQRAKSRQWQWQWQWQWFGPQ